MAQVPMSARGPDASSTARAPGLNAGLQALMDPRGRILKPGQAAVLSANSAVVPPELPYWHLNERFSYCTVKRIKLQRWYLGLLYQSIVLGVVLYTFIFVIWLKQGYLMFEYTTGYTYPKVKGRVRSTLGFFDEADVAVQDPLFITTRVRVTDTQQQGYCAPTFPDQTVFCNATDDCRQFSAPRCHNGVCLTTVPCTDEADCDGLWNARCDAASGTCQSWQWCPPEGSQVFSADPYNQTVNGSYEGVGNMTIWFRSIMQFPELGSSQYSTSQAVPQFEGPDKDLYTIDQLLDLLTPQTARDNIFDVGGFLVVKINWDCDVGREGSSPHHPCTVTRSVHRLDPNTGYNYKQARYPEGVDSEGAEAPDDAVTPQRDLIKVWGIRIHVVTTGKGHRFSIVALVTNLAVGISLTGIAASVTDIALKRVLGRPLYNMYVEETMEEMDARQEKQALLERRHRELEAKMAIKYDRDKGPADGGTVRETKRRPATGAPTKEPKPRRPFSVGYTVFRDEPPTAARDCVCGAPGRYAVADLGPGLQALVPRLWPGADRLCAACVQLLVHNAAGLYFVPSGQTVTDKPTPAGPAAALSSMPLSPPSAATHAAALSPDLYAPKPEPHPYTPHPPWPGGGTRTTVGSVSVMAGVTASVDL